MSTSVFVRRGVALLASAALPLSLLAVQGSAPAGAVDPAATGQLYHRLATYPVFQNVPAGADPSGETVAEISDVTDDGNTVVYTDALGQRVGFVDITDPSAPRGLGSIDVTAAPGGDAIDSPTSVAVVGGHVLVAVDTTDTDTEGLYAPGGRLDVYDVETRAHVRSFNLRGQPDSIAVSPDGTHAAVAIENQRNEDYAVTDGLPQLPAGFVQVLELDGAPSAWTRTKVDLPASALAGMDTPEDAEPEYGDINDDNEYVLTLQENNGLVVVDLETKEILHAFSAGNAQVSGIDDDNDGIFDLTADLDVPREPDAVQWVGDGLVATANEGDWKGGSRGWSVFDVTTGDVAWDAGSSFEHLALEHGLFNDDRADNKGSEPEGLAFEVVDGTPYAFVGSERSNFVAVYDMTAPREPALVQVLPTTNGPEGLLPIPSRGLFVVSSETDEAAAGVRSTVAVYGLADDRPAFPSVVSKPAAPGEPPIGWGALGALSADPTHADRLWSASDAAFATGRIYSMDASQAPAVIDGVLEVTEPGGARPEIDIEGLHARAEGGFWLAVEGADGPGNKLVRVDDAAEVVETVELPAEVTEHVRNWGLEGVTATGTGGDEVVYVALQRPLWEDPTVGAGAVRPKEGNIARIGRYDVAEGSWTWFGYRLRRTDTPGDWMGLSEVTALDDDTLLVVERDKLVGPQAAVKRVYAVDVPEIGGTDEPVMLRKDLAVDVLPHLRALHGWTQEKLEGLAVTADRQLVAVTDNDGVQDATGETQLLRLGSVEGIGRRTVQVLGTNDFHGRLQPNGAEAGAAVLAGAVEALEDEYGDTVFAAAGDLIGASTFDSFIAQDKPTIDALNAAGLDVSAVGNHELDAGYADLLDRVMAPYHPTDNPHGGAEWEYLGANIRMKATGEPAVPEKFVQDFGDVQVGFVGAVTEHLEELVSPAGIADLEITDVVEATNRVAAELREADGADVVVLLVHEGATTTSLASATDPDSDFGRIVNGVSADVDAIVSGHTHLAYNHAVEVPEWVAEERPVTTRPVVSAGQYGTNLNQLLFTFEGDQVVAVEQNLVAAAGYAPVQEVADLVADAKVDADVLGAEVLGELAGPARRAALAGGAENRGGESTLGNLVAEVQRVRTPAAVGGADVAFMNPGGLRKDLPGGSVTYRAAADVQPFANTLVNMTMTGAQVRQALEQQWQPAGAARPFLRLGASAGFTYTYDPTAPAGRRITGMWLDGDPVGAQQSLEVTVNSFLASGGDNFGAFTLGTDRADTGVSDLAAMVEFMADEAPVGSPLAVDASQRAVGVSFPADAPAAYAAGETVRFDVTSLAMTGSGDAQDAELVVSLGGREVGRATVDSSPSAVVADEAGRATVSFVVPPGTSAGTATVVLEGETTGTRAEVALQVRATQPEPSAGPTPGPVPTVQPSPTAQPEPGKVEVKKPGRRKSTVKVGKRKKIALRVVLRGTDEPGDFRARVTGVKGRKGLVKARLDRKGRLVLRIPVIAKPGKRRIVVRYSGDDVNPARTFRFTVRVRR
ncbi:esterase-like activity of phytase family protein [Nocardioides solisilvae]|uniref:esterase-like activity of phytase family protein n=1 Tax=Nocardioides solisilvae TaxID=1542435 RepID=UPI0019529BED|nr:esterase-like activity of phytase family protein [Nocardioides solisilvae]